MSSFVPLSSSFIFLFDLGLILVFGGTEAVSSDLEFRDADEDEEEEYEAE